jgi:uncharacterized protein (TIGR00369 family)
VSGGPERLFGVEAQLVSGHRAGSMNTGAWMAGPAGVPRSGPLGVLVDNVLGTTISARNPDENWSVSTEIGIDVVGAIPTDGTPVRATVQTVKVDAIGAFATGDVVDANGNVIARCRQRGRYVPSPVTTNGCTGVTRTDNDLMGWLGASVMDDVIKLTATRNLTNPMENLHGGVSLCISEWAGALALSRVGSPLSAASVHVSYLRPIPLGTRVRFTTRVVHAGRTLGVAHVTSHDEAGKPCTVTTLVTN